MSRSLIVLVLATTAFSAEPAWENVPQLRAAKDGSPYADLVSRFPQHRGMRWREYRTLDTTTHEMTHAINGIYSWNLNTQPQVVEAKLPKQFVFYVGQGKCFVLPASNVKIPAVHKLYQPVKAFADSERVYLFDRGQQTKDVLDIFDEWLAYMQDIRQGVYMLERPREYAGQRLDQAAAERLARFAYFATVVGMTIERDHPAYLDDRFKDFFRWCHHESAELVRQARRHKTLYPNDASRIALLCEPATTDADKWLRRTLDLRYDELYGDINPPAANPVTAEPLPAAQAVSTARRPRSE